MLETIAIVAVVLAIAIAIVLLLAATKPDSFGVQRAAIVDAPPESIFPLINDFRQWGSWSPYEHKDPAMKRTFSGAARGNGAVYAWEGDKNVGSGRMEILEAAAPSRIVIKLDFYSPFEAPSSRCCRRAMRPGSPGACMDRRRSWPGSCTCSSTSIRWSARILNLVSPI